MSRAGTYGDPSHRRRISWLAIAVFVLMFPVAGLAIPLGIHYQTAVIPLVAWGVLLALGVLAGVQIAADPRRWRGTGWLYAAVLMGPLIYFLSGSHFASTSRHGARPPCRVSMFYLGQGLRTFANIHEGELPPADRWCDALMETRIIDAEWVFRCPEARDSRRSYALNRALEGDLRGAPGDVVLVFESDAGRNAAGGRELLAAEPRHDGGYNFLFADRHVRWIEAEDVDSLHWEP